jgi:hypothetical protein
MARQETVLNVFISSPSDVSEDRDTVEEIIDEVNRSLSSNAKVRLLPLRWETNVIPGIGSDPQAVINTAIGGDYDVFVGIMGVRFGEPTPRFGSGTEEEFTNAYKKHLSVPDSLYVMFYFKDVPLHPSKIDTQQLASVNAFKAQLGSKGVLFSSYGSGDEFRKLLRIHFSEIVQTWHSPKRSLIAVKPATSSVSNINEDEEPSILDVVADMQDDFESLNATSGRMTAAMHDLTAKMNGRTAELNSFNQQENVLDFRRAKRICAAIAQDMDEFHERLEPELNIFSQTHTRLMDRTIKIISQMRDSKNKGLEKVGELNGSIGGYANILGQLVVVIEGFRDSNRDLPRATVEFNKSRNRVGRLLDRFIETLTGAQKLTLETQRVITGLTTL